MQTLDAPHPIQRDVLPGRVLASRGTGPGMRLGWSGMTFAIDGRADVPLRHLSHDTLSAIAAKKKRPTASCCRSVWEGMSNPNTRRVAQKIRGNHAVVNETLTGGLP